MIKTFVFLVLAQASVCAYGPERSGPVWCSRYPGSNLLSGLSSDFHPKARDFINAMREAGAHVHIASTCRPDERQYLMHWCWKIGKENEILKYIVCPGPNAPWHFNPIPPYDKNDDVKIIWSWAGLFSAPHPPPVICQYGCSNHTHLGVESIEASRKMITSYSLIFPPARTSKHVQKTAVDMKISWSETLNIIDKNGEMQSISDEPRTGNNTKLHIIGASYGVHKLLCDPPHWSDDGR